MPQIHAEALGCALDTQEMTQPRDSHWRLHERRQGLD
jgi:hypothetical protein